MEKDWIIRKAEITDSPGLTNCMKSAYAKYQNRMVGERLPPMDVDYAVEIRDYPSWVIEDSGVIAGGLIMIFEEEYASIANMNAMIPVFI